ncbi:GMC family oxidoreductase [Paraburkholderia antibiotica]|uniref:Choline dehydrogenase n=1 Tax=Paraburkholderia antibiotica TaxID=2728839 RepID=A0A7X9X6X9_9BURK|nr:choline dehydrogenase [Paraburkholderia antibiotica]NML32209.1 choline dehydrogenase [Paraburkholderia antibiotica]
MQTEQFDYVIVGAGSAGCVLANRLSADGQHRVLLVEAGGKDRNIWIHVPLGYGKTMFNRKLNWMFETEPVPQLNARRVKQPRGRVLGGSSSLNGLLYVRGQREDYDDWQDMGCDGWGYDDVLPYFIRSEDQQRGADPWHGTGGPLAVSDFPDGSHPIADAFIASATAQGIPSNDDFNGERQEGVGYFQATARNGRRCSTAVGFLRPAMRRGNLVVRTNAKVQRVLFAGKRATGIEYRHDDGSVHTALARREVILSAGAIQTPQLLELSGIGQPALLSRLGVPLVHAAPGVGENLQDHLQARLIYNTRDKITVNDDLGSLYRKARMVLRYVASRRGPLTWLAGIAGGFARTDPSLSRPDIQFHLYPYSSDRADPSLHPFSAFTLTVCKLRPEARGSVHATSSDPLAPPSIQPNYLDHPADVATMIAAVKLGRSVIAGTPTQQLVSQEYSPGRDCRSEADILEFIREKAFSVYHPVGSCRMGSDLAAPVDPQLRVRGVDGLRVADASIMPIIVSGNTNAAAIMIGEKAADLIMQSQ